MNIVDVLYTPNEDFIYLVIEQEGKKFIRLKNVKDNYCVDTPLKDMTQLIKRLQKFDPDKVAEEQLHITNRV
jgi:hypothetical protein